jgi:hypothetical protein
MTENVYGQKLENRVGLLPALQTQGLDFKSQCHQKAKHGLEAWLKQQSTRVLS